MSNARREIRIKKAKDMMLSFKKSKMGMWGAIILTIFYSDRNIWSNSTSFRYTAVWRSKRHSAASKYRPLAGHR